MAGFGCVVSVVGRSGEKRGVKTKKAKKKEKKEKKPGPRRVDKVSGISPLALSFGLVCLVVRPIRLFFFFLLLKDGQGDCFFH